MYSTISYALAALVLLHLYVWQCNSVQIVQVFADQEYDVDSNIVMATVKKHNHKNFVIGSRIAGDRLVGHFYNTTNKLPIGNYTLDFSYPQRGVGAMLSYVQFTTYQDTNLTSYAILSGGIRTRKMAIRISSNLTHYITYNADFYGS